MSKLPKEDDPYSTCIANVPVPANIVPRPIFQLYVDPVVDEFKRLMATQ